MSNLTNSETIRLEALSLAVQSKPARPAHLLVQDAESFEKFLKGESNE